MPFNRYYNTFALDKEKTTKHIPPANKEWKNSVYSFNKNLLKDNSIKDYNTDNIMKSYFNAAFFSEKNRKSIRMRSYIKRSSTKKVFISKPDIKQTTNKAIVTLYVFDREYQLFKPNLFLLNKLLKSRNSYFMKNTFLRTNNFFRKISSRLKKNKFSVKLSRNKKNRFIFKRHNNNYRFNYNLFPKLIMPLFINKRSLLKDLFMYSFLKWVLKKNFNININISKFCNNCNKKYVDNKKSNKKCINCGTLSNNISMILVIYKYEEKLFTVKDFNFKDIKKVNIILSKLLNDLIYKTIDNNQSTIIKNLFVNFLTIKNTLFINKVLLKEYNIVNTFTKYNYSKYKYTALLSNIKNFALNIYKKNIELNIVNLRYLHLNSDIFMEALAIKIKKKLSLLKVLKRSLNLVKRPSKFSGMLVSKDSLFKKNLSMIPNNFLESILKEKSISVDQHNFNTTNNVLNSLKYKWISGIKLEAKGRLTKRYTASRAIFKYVTKGNLRNLDKFYNTEFDVAAPRVYLIRNQFKPNLQYSYVYSNKRIGTFGLKGWISSV